MIIKMFKTIFSGLAVLAIVFLFAKGVAAQVATDTDGDGYNDEVELAHGYSPYNAEPVKIEESDADGDGLSDYWELKFKTDALNADSDGDTYLDGREVDYAFDPLSSTAERLPRRIELDLKNQQLVYLVAEQPWKSFTVSTGKPSMPTATGTFKIINKIEKAWSGTYKLWMPYWLGLGNGSFGIHELPIWPSGYREGEDHLGQPVSHGCIRLGIGAAQYVYDRMDVGSEVIIR
ncbi:TPA: hypothetical protein DCZ15_03730 [Candidatus Falkowbacteria bacterium]|nr:hypothetical protein [Candidatus Falkowbacteria bacterium]